MTVHHPDRFADELSAKLATRSRHVGVFLGAGSSRACGIPDVAQLTALVAKGLAGDQKKAFAKLIEGRSLEQLLSRVRRIAALLGSGAGTVDGLDGGSAKSLDKRICELIVKELAVDDAELDAAKSFAAWAGHADYHQPVEVFTVNYDLVLETAFEEHSVPYFDGFVGALEAPFFTELVEGRSTDVNSWIPPFFVRLWKLHGSVNWEWGDGDTASVVRRGVPVPSGGLAAIYPSDAKYDESRRMPFVVLQDRFRRSLQHPESLFLVSGYAFGDSHLNELLFDAASRRPRSEIVVFCFDEIPPDAATRAQVTPNLQLVSPTEALIGGVRAAWEPPAVARPEVWANDRFLLGDFAELAGFLARNSRTEHDPELTPAKSPITGQAE